MNVPSGTQQQYLCSGNEWQSVSGRCVIPSNAYPALSGIGYRADGQSVRTEFHAGCISALKASAAG